jgi:ornithine cyclodeaminase/alanine dehydrogenase-like protein (mu-crystallin family)
MGAFEVSMKKVSKEINSLNWEEVLMVPERGQGPFYKRVKVYSVNRREGKKFAKRIRERFGRYEVVVEDIEVK